MNWRVSSRPSSSRCWRQWLLSDPTPTPPSKLVAVNSYRNNHVTCRNNVVNALSKHLNSSTFFFFENWDSFNFCQFCWIFCFIISAIVTIDWWIVFLLFKLTTDPFDCGDCHLTWLIRDNRRLLPAVVGGSCSNGMRFGALDPIGYENCPVIISGGCISTILFGVLYNFYLLQVFTCPLGYDGDYADPLSCTSYYTCREDVADKSVNIKLTTERVFSEFLNSLKS